MSDPTLRIALEVISAVVCIILIRFMIKPYMVTREGRYIGLPLGFGFLGASYALSAWAYIQPNFYDSDVNSVKWIQLLFRGFSFVFLAVSYYFSKKPTKNSRYAWDIAFSGLFVGLAASLIVYFVSPYVPLQNYSTLNIFIRFVNIACLSFICIHCYREYAKDPEPISKWILYGYALLGASQLIYLILYFISSGSTSDYAFNISVTLRLLALATFLFATYRTFYQFVKGIIK